MFKTVYFEFLGLKAHYNGITDKAALTMHLPRDTKKFIHALCKDLAAYAGFDLHSSRSFSESVIQTTEVFKDFPLDRLDVKNLEYWAARPKSIHKVYNTTLQGSVKMVNDVLSFLFNSEDQAIIDYRREFCKSIINRAYNDYRDAQDDLGMVLLR